MHGLYSALDRLGIQILQAIALDLGLPETFFDETVQDRVTPALCLCTLMVRTFQR